MRKCLTPEPSRPGRDMSEYSRLEVKWYKKYGKYPDRIINAGTPDEYVVGDESWNKKHINRQELIESRMAFDISIMKPTTTDRSRQP